jgi:hypothetical protein
MDEVMTQWSLHGPLGKRMTCSLGGAVLSGESMGNELAHTSRHWVFATVRRDWDRTHLNRAAGDQVSDVQLIDLRIVNNREECIWVHNGPDIYQTVRLNAGRVGPSCFDSVEIGIR